MVAVATFAALGGPAAATATGTGASGGGGAAPSGKRITNADRVAAAARAEKQGVKPATATLGTAKTAALATTAAAMSPQGTPDYFGSTPNYANSPLPVLDATGKVVPGSGVRKFVDSLPGVGAANTNDLGQFIPVAVPDTITYPGSDYYEIELRQYTQQLSKDLPATQLEGYVQVNKGTDTSGRNTIAPSSIQYLGPMIVANSGRPVRVKFTNKLPTGTGGNMFLPVDPSIMGAGDGPHQIGTALDGSPIWEQYTQNRATLHLHGGDTPWISDGTPDQWTTPAGENTSYPKGVSVQYVPDMYFVNGQPVAKGTAGASNDPGPGSLTFYYTNQQSARLMWYHDHSYGITRLNVYAGQAAPYLLHDPTEQGLVSNGTLPSAEVPLVIQDKTFVPPPAQLAAEDPTWNVAQWGGTGNLWYPHVYMPNQNPADPQGVNAMGRWDYGPWFWPPVTTLNPPPAANPLAVPAAPWENAVNPGTPNPSAVPEAFMDTPMVNGTAYPYMTVDPKAYRFQILNASNDRTLNLQLYYAKSNAQMWNLDGSLADGNAGEVPMIAAVKTAGAPATWPTDGRDGGVPDPNASGPPMIQIGNEGGVLPAPVTINSQPINYEYNRRSITVLNVSDHGLLLGPAERADVIVDFSRVPAGSKLILYNDAPAPVPAFDPRYDYYTGDPDQTSTGGAPSTLLGYGPNTRTVMQFKVSAAPAATTFNTAALPAAIGRMFAATQPKPIVPEAAYNAAYGTSYTNSYAHIQDNSMTFTPAGAAAPVTIGTQPKAIQELFDEAGRMNSTLGVELPFTNITKQTTIPLGYIDPATETFSNSDAATQIGSLGDGTQIWKITHNGVDTHFVHFHLFNVQVINRVGWDGTIKPPDPNEVGWKETVRMNPLEDIILAMRPIAPSLPFKIPDSIRPMDVTKPIGWSSAFTNIDPLTNNPITPGLTNQLVDYGWEYVWHCHILGHEENDMMRPIVFKVSPDTPAFFAATATRAGTTPPAINVTWANIAPPSKVTNLTLQRATDAAFTQNVTNITLATTLLGPPSSYRDTAATVNTAYYYRLRAENAVSYSPWTAVATDTPLTRFAAPSNLAAGLSLTAPLNVTVTWTNRSSGPTGYVLQRASNAGFSAGLQVINVPSGTTYIDTALALNTTYYYRVSARNAGTSSGWSNTMGVVVAAPAAPTRLSANASSQRVNPPTVTLGWQENSASVVGAFTVQRSTNPAFPLTSPPSQSFTVSGNSRSFVDVNLSRNTTYYYRIQASNGAGGSAWVTATVTTPR